MDKNYSDLSFEIPKAKSMQDEVFKKHREKEDHDLF
jgi:hypothetical protein